MNTALKVLLEHRDEEKASTSNELLKNFEKLVFPYLPSINPVKNSSDLNTTLSIIERNIKEILLNIDTPKLAVHRLLSPTEIKIAVMIKDGKISKEIAKNLNLSVRTVYFHRENIRKKLSLSNAKTSLRSYLQSIL